MQDFRDDLQQRRARHLYRTRRLIDSPQGVIVQADGETLLSFCSNDYLGLANDPRVVKAFRDAAARYGVGSGASHLVTGHMRPHHALEEELAAFVGAERALLFSTGYMANLGIAGALLDRRAIVFEDRLNHASLIDAAHGSPATVKRYRHLDMDQLGAQLAGTAGEKLILTDGVFSMDGDLAPLPALMPLAQQHRARLLVDDAHGIGVLGVNGRGSFEHFGIPLAPPAILLGTLGKAFGTFGAFVAGEGDLIEYLIQSARTYIYTTALPPAVAEATRASLRIVQGEPERRASLQARIVRFRTGATQLGLRLLDSPTPVQPVILGAAEVAVKVSETLRAQGILVPAIRPPTVPDGSSRLRVSFSALHTEADVDRLLGALGSAVSSPS